MLDISVKLVDAIYNEAVELVVFPAKSVYMNSLVESEGVNEQVGSPAYNHLGM